MGLAVALGALAPATPALGDYSYEFHSFLAGDGGQSGQDEVCPEGIAISGGVSAVAGYAEGLYLNTSRPGTLAMNDTGWTIYVDNYAGGAGTLNPRVYAVCDKNGEEADYRIRQESFVVPDSDEGGGVAKCKSGEFVVGGGGNSSGFYEDETYLSTSAPYDGPDQDKRPADGWRVELNNDEDQALVEATVGVFAVCDRKHDASDFRYVRKSRKVPDGTQKFRPAPCKPSETAVGGGVRAKSTYDHGLYINTTFPNVLANHTLWQAAVDNYDTPDDKDRKITTTAICRR